jgi:ferritin-like metal-binding protein YciE
MTNEQDNNYIYNTKNQLFNIEKFVVYLNNLLAIENESENRLQSRIQNTIANEIRQILEHHFEETRKQQDRLRYLITKLGGIPTTQKSRLPGLTSPPSIEKELRKIMTVAEVELKEIEQDTILENAEIIAYNLLLQIAIKMSIDDNVKEAIPVLRQNLEEEEKMNWWLTTKLPIIFAKLWPEIVSHSSMTAEQAEIINNIKQTFTCEICDNVFFDSPNELKLHIIADHNQLH